MFNHFLWGCTNQIIQRRNRQEDQWQFFVVATRRIDAALGVQESLSLSRLLKLGPIQCSYGRISSAIDKVMDMD